MLYILLLLAHCISFSVNELFSNFLHFHIEICKSSLCTLVTKLSSAKNAVILSHYLSPVITSRFSSFVEKLKSFNGQTCHFSSISFWILCLAWILLHPTLPRPDKQYMEKEMATHSSVLAWRIPGTEEPGRLQSMGPPRVRHDWVTSLSQRV